MSQLAPRESWSDLDDAILAAWIRIYENPLAPPLTFQLINGVGDSVLVLSLALESRGRGPCPVARLDLCAGRHDSGEGRLQPRGSTSNCRFWTAASRGRSALIPPQRFIIHPQITPGTDKRFDKLGNRADAWTQLRSAKTGLRGVKGREVQGKLRRLQSPRAQNNSRRRAHGT